MAPIHITRLATAAALAVTASVAGASTPHRVGAALLQHYDNANTASAVTAAGWTLAPSGSVGTGAQFFAAAGTTANVWAVGDNFDARTSNTSALAEHWKGSAWSVVAAPSPGTDTELHGVAAVTGSDDWAVGFSNSSSWAANTTLAEHWNGTSWTVVPTPNPGHATNELWGAYAVSSNDVWAVGDAAPGIRYDSKTLIEHWNGTAWSVVPSPNVGPTDYLHTVSGTSATDVWAVGTSYDTRGSGSTRVLVEHWNGTAWSVTPAPTAGSFAYVRSVSAVSTSDAWFIGEASATASPLVEHWDGRAWSLVPSPNLGPISGVVGLSRTDAWIAGVRGYVGALGGTLIEHWNGTSWAAVPSPNRVSGNGAFDSLNAVTRVGTSNMLFAVGGYQTHSAGGALILQTSSG